LNPEVKSAELISAMTFQASIRTGVKSAESISAVTFPAYIEHGSKIDEILIFSDVSIWSKIVELISSQ